MARGPTLTGVAVLAMVIVAGGYAANQVKARHELQLRVHALTGGDADRGRALLARAPCGGCHRIPGVSGARGRVAPPLTHFAARAFIGGEANNTPDNLIQWIKDPRAIEPNTAMPPNPQLSDREARDIAAYLYTLS